MKATIGSTKAFSPVKLSLVIESEEELKVLRMLVLANIRVPDAVFSRKDALYNTCVTVLGSVEQALRARDLI